MKPAKIKPTIGQRFRNVFKAWTGSTFDPRFTERRWRSWFYPDLRDEPEQHDDQSRRTYVTEARWLYDFNPFVRGVVDSKAKLSAGSKGFTLQSRVADSPTATEYENYWTEWQKVADARGQVNFAQMLKLASKALDVDGEIFFVRIGGDQSAAGMLQAIHSHRCEDDPKRKDDTTQGVGLTDFGRPAFYRFRTDSGGYTDLDARDVIHLFDPMRFDQVRGQSAIGSAVERHLRDLDDLIALEKLGAKTASAIALLRQNATGEAENPYGGETPTAGQLPTEQQLGGATVYTGIGEKLEAFVSNRPSPAWQGLVELLVREVCQALDWPYEFAVNPAGAGGTAQRAILQKVQAAVDDRQQILLKFASAVFVWVIAKGIRNGRLTPSADWWRHEWQPGRGLTVDFGREATAFMAMHRQGLMTADEFYGMRGMDWQDQYRQKAAEQAYINALAGEFGVSPQQLQILTPNANESQGGSTAGADENTQLEQKAA